jgi:single-stranded-DNA-specific exonuclease
MKQNTGNIIEILLKNRGIETPQQREEFFNPKDPKNLKPEDVGIEPKNVKKALARIKKAIEKKEKIIIYGDYDVDGICATAILWETLKSIGADVMPYIPSRFTEGYGLNIESVKALVKDDPKIKLLITVDNGIVAGEKVELAKELGLDVIITDHHLPGKTLPKAHTILHTTKISGAAVAWFLARALLLSFQPPTSNVQPLSDHLGLAALGTVTDVLPLVGFNRAIVVYGLKELKGTKRHGIVAICEEAGIKQEELDAFHIGFVMGPRLNAAGRLEHAMNSLRTLCTKDPSRAAGLAAKLGQTNRERQDKTQSTISHVDRAFSPSWVEGNLPKVLLAHHESYDEGIVGIVAGRLVEKYNRPALVVSEGQEISKGSARSVMGINIIDIIKKAGGDLLIAAGGHPMAAGFSLKTKNLEEFKNLLQAVASEDIEDKQLIKNTRIDSSLDLGEVTNELHEEILHFQPFGYGNPEPTFESVTTIKSYRTVGKDNAHLKLVLKGGDLLWDAIGFRLGPIADELKNNQEIRIVYSVEEDTWPARNASLPASQVQRGSQDALPASPSMRAGSVAGGNGKKKLQLKLKNINFS